MRSILQLNVRLHFKQIAWSINDLYRDISIFRIL